MTFIDNSTLIERIHAFGFEEFFERNLSEGMWNEELINNKDIWESLSQEAPIKFIEKYINQDWNWGGISNNPHITLEFVEKNMDKCWNIYGYNGLLSNPIITPEFMHKNGENLHFEWDWSLFSSNPSVTPEFIEKHPHECWNWRLLSSNPSITPEFIEKHIDKEWYWGANYLSSNPTITPEFVEKHIDKEWYWEVNGLSSNPSIPSEFIEKHMNRLSESTVGIAKYPKIDHEPSIVCEVDTFQSLPSTKESILLKKCSFLTLVDKIVQEENNKSLLNQAFNIEIRFEPVQESASNKYCSMFDIVKYCSTHQVYTFLNFVLENKDELFQ